ncbi:MAG: hypothetical protein JWM09_723 [Francisellaceae bacterium]|nr:hypothetical protein [Francisellaceae bacterium]
MEKGIGIKMEKFKQYFAKFKLFCKTKGKVLLVNLKKIWNLIKRCWTISIPEPVLEKPYNLETELPQPPITLGNQATDLKKNEKTQEPGQEYELSIRIDSFASQPLPKIASPTVTSLSDNPKTITEVNQIAPPVLLYLHQNPLAVNSSTMPQQKEGIHLGPALNNNEIPISPLQLSSPASNTSDEDWVNVGNLSDISLSPNL